MSAVLAAIIPIVAILILGKVVSTTRWISEEGWLGLESITYYVLFPALIVSKLSVADFSGVDWRMPTSLIGAQLIMAGVSILIARVLRHPSEQIGVIVQSGVRWNTFIALAIAQDLIGPTGLALVAAAAAVMIPTANALSILALSRFSGRDRSAGGLLRKMIKNPLIIACLIGLGLNVLQVNLPTSVLDVLDLLSQATIAIGLLATGTHIQLRTDQTPLRLLLGWSVFRLMGLPIIAGSLALLLGTPPTVLLVVMIATAVPTASNGAILARQLGGDAKLAANLIATQTVLALVSVTIILWFTDTMVLR